MIAATLAASHAPRYRHAARHLADCASAAPRVPDFGTTPDHAAFERALRAAYPAPDRLLGRRRGIAR